MHPQVTICAGVEGCTYRYDNYMAFYIVKGCWGNGRLVVREVT